MRRAALKYLACPRCDADLALATPAAPESSDHVMTGDLVCQAAGCRYPIRDGVPVLVLSHVDRARRETAERFTLEWTHWRGMADYYERQFLEWIAPVTREEFKDRVVLEGGCGKGRHSAIVSGFGPTALVSIDLGDSAFVAFENTHRLPNVHVAIGDVVEPPVKAAFDLAFSVGVLHHLPDPAQGFHSLCAKVKNGGRIVTWVYGREHNEWIVTFVDPVRKAITARLPSSVLRAISALPSSVLWGLIHTLYRGPSHLFGRKLPYFDYFASMSGFPYAEIHSIVFDQLVTPVAHYLPEAEVRRWCSGDVEDVVIRWNREMSWTATATIARPRTG